jgi:hypothetical protein
VTVVHIRIVKPFFLMLLMQSTPKMQNSYSNETDVNYDQNNMAWDLCSSQDIADGLSMARAFLEDCESSDQVGDQIATLL